MALRVFDSRAEAWRVYGLALALTVAGFAIAYQFVEPAPPRSITISAGAPGGAYHDYAHRYAALLARDGVELRVLESAGSVENLARLTAPDGAVQLALVQGGVGDRERHPGLVALGSLYYEPLWIFHRADMPLELLGDLRGRRVAIGAEGSGTRAIMRTLLRANGMQTDDLVALELGTAQAAEALLGGAIDAAAFVGSARSDALRTLLVAPEVAVLSMTRAEAYARRYPFLNRVNLPRGAISLADDLPARDVELLAPAATLVAREDLHPALVDLLLQVVSRVHGGGSLFERPGQFPSPRYVDFELADEARRHYESGPPLLQRYLPFWAATLADRMKVLMLPLITVLFPLFKIVPPFYSWRVRRRIYRWYRDVRDIEMAYLDEPESAARETGLARLAEIERELVGLRVPLGVADALYHLRLHIGFVREELAGERERPP